MDQLVCSNGHGQTQATLFSTLITQIYDSVTQSDGFSYFLQRACEAIGCLSGDIAAINIETGEYIGGWQYGFKKEDVKLHIEKGFVHQDPLVQKALRSPIGQFIKLRDTVDWGDYIQTDIYREWGSRFDLYDATGTILSYEGKVITGIFFQKNRHQQLFTEQQIELLNALVPHLLQATSLYFRLMERGISNKPLKEALNLIKSPTILFDRRGIISFVNRAAQEFAEKCKWLKVEDRQLVIANPELKGRFNILLSKTVVCSFTEEGFEGGIIHSDISGEKIAFCMQPMNTSSETETHGGALLFIHQQNRNIDESKVNQVKELFHLTPAEAQVSLLLSQGMSIKAIAEYTTRKEGTIRTQLKSAFAKTGTGTQSQLVSLIMTSPVFLT